VNGCTTSRYPERFSRHGRRGCRVDARHILVWQSRFGGDPAISGKLIQLDGSAVRIAGVLPADFETPTLSRGDIVLPTQLDESTAVPVAG